MNNKSIVKKLVAVALAFLLLFGTTAPLTSSVYVEAADIKAVDTQIQNESLHIPPIKKMPIAAVGAIFSGITLAIKCIGAAKYATENHEYSSSESWINLALSYFSGNAHKLPIENLRDAMVHSLNMTNDSIKELENQIITLQEDIAKLSDKLTDSAAATELKSRLDDFYTNFFVPAYSDLIEAYYAVDNALGDKSINDATLRAKIDDLYMKANEMKKLDSYITGNSFFDNKGILDIYYEYTLTVNGITPDGSDLYYDAVTSVQDFAMKLYAASALQKLCSSYASSYQLHYYHQHYDEMVASGEFIGYVVEGTSNLSTNKFTEYEIKKNISSSASEINTNSGKIAKILSRIYLLDNNVGYIENGYAYYAPVYSSKLNVYPGATYNLFSISDNFDDIFEYDLTFVSDNDAVNISPNGSFTIDESIKNSFKISYVYGEGVLNTPITIYEIMFTPTTRVFSGGYGSEKSPYLISTPTQFKDFTNDSTYHSKDVAVKLINDINLSSVELTTISDYNGIFDGGNHKIYGMTRTSAVISKNHGTIKNLTVSDSKLSFSHAGSGYIGVIANSNDGKILNCHIKNTSVSIYCYNYSGGETGFINFTATAGGIVGINSGIVSHCSVTNDSIIKAETSTRELFSKGYYFEDKTSEVTILVGGIAGNNSGKVNNCFVGGSTITSKTYAMYFKWSFLWAKMYTRVSAVVNYGNIIGSNSGENYSNEYNSVTNSSHSIEKLKAKDKDDKFVTSNVTAGIHGTETSASLHSPYLTSISVKSHPLQTKYLEEDVFNFAGLELVDNMGNTVYGFKIDGFSSKDPGKCKIKLGYKGVESEITVDIGCIHKHTRVDEHVDPSCISDGFESGIYCLTCEQYIDLHNVLPKSNEYCKDDNNDHMCDNCETTISECIDSTDHICDICGKELSTCLDSNIDHLCDMCGKKLPNCKDENADHLCDICETTISECIDSLDHLCDICAKKLSTCTDSNKDHLCDTCAKKLSDCKDENADHLCDICETTISECIDSLDHLCDICGKVVSTCTDSDKDHLCDVCGEKLSECADKNNDHNCDICNIVLSEHYDFDDHNCDICSMHMTDHIDIDKNHFCDICMIHMGLHNADTGKHTCNYCGINVSECSDTDGNNRCEVCGDKLKNSTNISTIVGIVAASSVGFGGISLALWLLIRRKRHY